MTEASKPTSPETPSGDTALEQARALFERGSVNDAEGIVRRYLETHPDSAEGHFLLGHILFREIQNEAHEKGAQILNPARTRHSEEQAKASLAEFTAGAKFHVPSAADLKVVAFDYVLLGDYVDADKWLTRMLARTPADSEGWYYLGRAKYSENRFTEAISAFQQSLKLDPGSVKAEDNLGLSYAGLDRHEEALAAYKTAILWQAQVTQKNPGPYIDLGSFLLDQGRPEQAAPYLLEAIGIAPLESRAHELLGKAYARLEELGKAQTELEKAVELSPQSGNLHCMLAPVYRKQGLAEKAQVEFDRCAALAGSHSTRQVPRP
jgi:Flp pilus assembly protein TadD